MKRIIISLALCCSFIASPFAANTTKLNKQLASILVPFQNETTQAQAAFTTAYTNSNHALQVAINGFYSKVGSGNKATLAIENLSYDYDDGTAPKTVFKGAMVVDMTKFVSQSDLNLMLEQAAPTLEKLMQDFYLEQYGDAASAKVVVTSTKIDSDGNYIGLSGLITFKIDLSKISDEKEISYIAITETVLSFNLDTKKGFAINGFTISNPKFEAFSKDEKGLKEVLVALEKADGTLIYEVTSLVNELDSFFEKVVMGINNFKLNIPTHK